MQAQELIEMIRSGKAGRERAITMLHNDLDLRRVIKKMIYSGKGTQEDFEEIYNYALVQFLKTVMDNPDFGITSTVNGYIYGIARNLWLQELRKKNRMPELMPEDFHIPDDTPTIDLVILDKEKKAGLMKVLDLLGRNCRKVLMLWASNYKMTEIAEELNYSSAGVARKKKFNCMKELATFLDNHPKIKNMLSK